MQVPAAAALNTIPTDWHDRITTRSLWRPDGIPRNTASGSPLTGSDRSLSSTREERIIRTQGSLSDTDGKLRVGPQVPSEAAAGPVEEAEAESMQEVSRETGKFTQLPAPINFPLISVGSSALTQRRLGGEKEGETEGGFLLAELKGP